MEEGDTSCPEFFENLDDWGKVLFMLGGPVDGRTPETPVDSLARSFVLEAYTKRSELLKASADEPLIVDLSKEAAPVQKGRSR